jgi:hypothetical protein
MLQCCILIAERKNLTAAQSDSFKTLFCSFLFAISRWNDLSIHILQYYFHALKTLSIVNIDL